jgi:hypothetical protein
MLHRFYWPPLNEYTILIDINMNAKSHLDNRIVVDATKA